jgi:teichuronic acid biosynthesis glycosyltransferase TuaC
MRVLLLTAMWPTAHNPAFGSFVASQARELKQAGVDVDVLVLQGRSRKLIYPRGVLQLRRWMARPVDIVHAHYGYVGFVARTQWKVPVVVTYHGDDVLGTIDPDGRTTIPSRLTSGLCRKLGPFVDAVVVQSEQMARRFTHANVHIIPHEVDLETFQPSDKKHARQVLGLCCDAKYVLFAANPATAVKRFPLAQAAVERLRATDPAVELIVVHKEPQTRLALYMSAVDALVFPSWQEGSPNIVKQAMACNLPIVATDVGDVRQIIDGASFCYIAQPAADDFAAKLQPLLDSPARSNGRERVQHLAGPLVAQRVIRVYEETLRKRARLMTARTPGTV